MFICVIVLCVIILLSTNNLKKNLLKEVKFRDIIMLTAKSGNNTLSRKSKPVTSRIFRLG